MLVGCFRSPRVRVHLVWRLSMNCNHPEQMSSAEHCGWQDAEGEHDHQITQKIVAKLVSNKVKYRNNNNNEVHV